MSDPGSLAPAPAPLAGPRAGLLQRFLLQPHFPAVLRVTAGPELGRVGEWERREGASTHLSGSGRPYGGHPLQLAGGLCRSLRAWGGGGSRDCWAEGSSRPPPRGVLPSARQPDPPTHMPTGLQGPRSSGGWSVSPPPPIPSLLPHGGHLPAAMALSPQVLGPWVPVELCTGGAQPIWGAQRVQRALRSQSPAGW